MFTMPKIIDCIVMGAGPSGIVSTKEILENGIEDVLCLEASRTLGGVFAKGYDNLTLTSSCTFSMFSDFWVGDEHINNFWTKEEAISYWTRYAEHFGVAERVRFGAKVSSVVRTDSGTWELTTKDEVFRCKRLVVATGNNSEARSPCWKEKLTRVSSLHSQDYKNAENFKGKRVVVIGGGESASDVAYEISRVAEQCWVSIRESTGWIVPRKRGPHASDNSTHRGMWDLPREFGAYLSKRVLELERARKDPIFDALADINSLVKAKNGIWGTFGTKTLALPTAVAHHNCRIVKDILEVDSGGTVLKTVDGEVLKDIDAVVFCTGYSNQSPFLPDALKNYNPRRLYKQTFHHEYRDSLAFVGRARSAFGSQFPVAEMQARFCGLVFSGKHQLPSSKEMQQVVRVDFNRIFEQFQENAIKIPSLVDYHRFMNDLSKVIGCYPRLRHYFFSNPKLWLKLIYGPTQGTQFRLDGPGSKPEVAREILERLPLSTFNHIVKLGIRGRVVYFFKHLASIFKKTKLPNLDPYQDKVLQAVEFPRKSEN